MQQATAGSSYSEDSWSREAYSSGVSWSAVVAGAFVTAALSLALLALGAGFGLLSVSPWSNAGASASTLDAAAIVWLVVIQIVASGAGGYLAGRLRTKWVAIHTDEVYFRDTAHGFLVWAVAAVITAALLGTAATAMVGGAATRTVAAAPESEYFVDSLFRSAPGASAPLAGSGGAVKAEDDATLRETGGILANVLRQKGASEADTNYLAQLVCARTGLTQNEAAERVSEVVMHMRETADALRRTTARLLLWTFLSLLIGAFCASYSATIGGRQRDHMKAV